MGAPGAASGDRCGRSEGVEESAVDAVTRGDVPSASESASVFVAPFARGSGGVIPLVVNLGVRGDEDDDDA